MFFLCFVLLVYMFYMVISDTQEMIPLVYSEKTAVLASIKPKRAASLPLTPRRSTHNCTRKRLSGFIHF